MFENSFSKPCTALVGANGRTLSGKELEAAEAALASARSSGLKVWSDRNGYIYTRKRALFSPATKLTDANGSPVRICGKRVGKDAQFCTKCGAPAPDCRWRCDGCGFHIESKSGLDSCPKCGRKRNAAPQSDLADGVWNKPDDIFAERFEFPDADPLLGSGLRLQEGQCAVLVRGGAAVETLGPGFYAKADLAAKAAAENGSWSLVLIDGSEFALPVCVEQIFTSDDIMADLHIAPAFKFSPEGAKDFMSNLMGGSMQLGAGAITTSLSCDEVAHALLQSVDTAARDFCSTVTVSELFRDAETRLKLENHIAQAMSRNLSAVGLLFVRLKEAEFESEVFTRLREKSGQVEAKRREIEFMLRAAELANEATRREAMGEYEMEEYISRLAHEKKISDEIRDQELELLRIRWEQRKQLEARSLQDEADMALKLRKAEHEEAILELHWRQELAQRIEEQKKSVECMQFEAQIQAIKLENEKKKTRADQEAAEGWLKIKQKKAEFEQKQKIEMINAVSGADMRALLMVESDPEKRAQLLQLNEQEMVLKMTPELLLAAAAARGNPAAADELSRLNREQIEAIERSKQENRVVYERMLRMSDKSFESSLESLSEGGSSDPSAK